MGDAKNTAVDNHGSSQVVGDEKPSDTKPCPYMKRLRLGVFFDGTGNNKYSDAPGAETNVTRLFNVYLDTSDNLIIREKRYLVGVGGGSATAKTTTTRKGRFTTSTSTPDASSSMQSDVGTGFWGKAIGKGADDRLKKAYAWVKATVQRHSDQYMEDSEKLVDIWGFSRGASFARTFNNLVNQALPKEEKTRNTQVRFLGIFDTVDSSHGQDMNLGLASTDFKGCRHFTARDEVRSNFPLTLLGTNDIEFAGVHADVGGGYAPGEDGRNNHLAYPPLMAMYTAAHDEQKVEFTGPPPLPGGVDVDKMKADSDLYDGTGSDKSTAASKEWRSHYVHDSTGFMPQNWANNVVTETDFMGEPTKIERKRERLTVKKLTLDGMPPNFSWK